MKKWTIKNGKKEVSKEWLSTERQYQKELIKIPRLCYYDWKDDPAYQKGGYIVSKPTLAYKKLIDKYDKILVEDK